MVAIFFIKLSEHMIIVHFCTVTYFKFFPLISFNSSSLFRYFCIYS